MVVSSVWLAKASSLPVVLVANQDYIAEWQGEAG